MRNVKKLFFVLNLLFIIITHTPSDVFPVEGNGESHTTHSVIEDYDPLTGQPKCINCHNGEAKPSIDYNRDATCLQCHSTGYSDKFEAIDSRFDKTIIASVELNPPTPPLQKGGTLESPLEKGGKTEAPLQKGGTSKAPLKKGGSPANIPPLEKGGQGGFEQGSLKNMILIPEGEFTMGSNEWWPKCQPEHKRTVKAFYIDKYEVTNKKYKKFVEATKRQLPANWIKGAIPKGKENHPVVFVSWYDGNDYCKWEGKRLPTEVEWEKAARGTDGRTFPWGNKFDAKKGNMPQLGKGDTMPIGSFESGKSPYGLYDMAGNVFEWTSDWFKPYPGNTHPDENYGEKYKVVRGGSWYDCTYYKCGISAPTYNRIFFNPYTTNNNFGFRCAKD